MKYTAAIKDRQFKISISESEGEKIIDVDGQCVTVELKQVGSSNMYSFLFDNNSFDFEVNKNEHGYTICFEGRTFKCDIEDERHSAIRSALGASKEAVRAKELRSPMPGLILAVKVNEGDRVSEGDGLVVVEAMKMENELTVCENVTIKEIKVKEGQAVEKDQVLIVFE